MSFWKVVVKYLFKNIQNDIKKPTHALEKFIYQLLKNSKIHTLKNVDVTRVC